MIKALKLLLTISTFLALLLILPSSLKFFNVSAAQPDCLFEPDYAPQFSRFEPPSPVQKDQNVTGIFIPPTLTADPKYKVVFNVEVKRRNLNFNKSPSQWTVNLGKFGKGIYGVVWNMIFVDDNNRNQKQKCGQADLFVCDGSNCPTYPGPGSTGENPCKGGPDGTPICPTALGDIPANPIKFAEKFLRIAIGIGGGIAFILMVFGAIRVLTSSGDQQRLSGGRDMIVAAIAGILFIIFSVLILRFVGIQILGI